MRALRFFWKLDFDCFDTCCDCRNDTANRLANVDDTSWKWDGFLKEKKTLFSIHKISTILPIHDDSTPVNLSVSFLLYSFEFPLNAAFTIPINDMHWPNWKISIILTDAARNWKIESLSIKLLLALFSFLFFWFDLFEILVKDSAEIDNHRCHNPVDRSNSAWLIRLFSMEFYSFFRNYQVSPSWVKWEFFHYFHKIKCSSRLWTD